CFPASRACFPASRAAFRFAAAAAEAKKLARYDRNKNGKLDEDELAAAKADEEKRQAAAAKRKAAREAGKQALDAGKQAPEPEADDAPPPDHD
ncbi:MAG TPA: hypothetical protein VFC28_03895, partial [Opitutaceae bacterium]|nr:hypothetical protein [Opitutaceae bacterium]